MKLLCTLLLLAFSLFTSAKEYHVSVSGSNSNTGTSFKPFRTIGYASVIAKAGDVITVHEGIYRELISPLRGGTSALKRIVYRAARGEKVEIKGSEVVTGWEMINPGIWKVRIPDAFFRDYNPFKEEIKGDWFFPSKGKVPHTGEVYLNGKSLQEVFSVDSVSARGTWYALSESEQTTVYANFKRLDPNLEMVEINVRPACFYPAKTGVNYITVKGFHMSQAATQWAAPTAEQVLRFCHYNAK